MTITLEQLEVALNQVQAELEKLKAAKPTGRWLPEYRQQYWFVDSGGSVQGQLFCGDRHDKLRLSVGKVFRTKDEAQRRLDRDILIGELREAAGWYVPVWDGGKRHYHLFYNTKDKHWGWTDRTYYDYNPLSGYFPSADKSIIDRFKDRLHLLLEVQS